MKSYNESTNQPSLRKELLHIDEGPSSLTILSWLYRFIPQDLINAILIQRVDINKSQAFDKLGGTNWYFRAAFDQTYEADGYDVNSDKLVPALDEITLDSDEWESHPEYQEHTKSAPMSNSQDSSADNLNISPVNSTSKTAQLELEEYLDSLHTPESEIIHQIEQVVKEEIDTVEALDRVITFLGFPSRRIQTTIEYPFNYWHAFSDENEKSKVSFYTIWPLFLSNLIGGWDDPATISTEKQIWQWFSLPVKILLILPIKFLTLIPKFSLNCLKLFTEFLPLVAMRFSAHAFGWSLQKFAAVKFHHIKKSSKADWEDTILYSSYKIFLFIVSLLPLSLYFISRTLAFIGRAVTSPEKGARMAIRNGRMLKTSLFGKSLTPFISVLLGLIGGCLSLSITVLSWAILFPILIGSLTTLPIDIIQLTTIALSKLTSIMNLLPLGNTIIIFFQNAYVALTPILLSVFGPTIISASSSLFGIKLATHFMVKFCFVGVTLAITAPILSRVADILSNAWASWKNNGPFTYFFNFLSRIVSLISFEQETKTNNSLGPDSRKKDQFSDKNGIAEKNSSIAQPPIKIPSRPADDLGDGLQSAVMSAESSEEGAALYEQLALIAGQKEPSENGDSPPTIRVKGHSDTQSKSQQNSLN